VGKPGGEVQTFQTVERFRTLIPSGHTYRCVYDYWHGGDRPAYEIIWPWDEDGDGQPDRDRLLIHPANAVRNRGGEFSLLGCIAPGLVRAEFWGNATSDLAKNLPGVGGSVRAFNAFMAANEGVREFMLKITGDAPT
jgi:hypothetical protein